MRLDAFDAYACRGCDLWMSKPCSVEPGGCSYCDLLRQTSRPSDAPIAVWNNPWNT